MSLLSLRVCLCVLSLLSYVAAQTVATVDLQQNMQYLPTVYGKSNFTLDDAKRLLRQKCLKASATPDSGNGTQAYEQIEPAFGKLMKCANSLANVTQILEEVERARPLGDLDVVFEKYCDRLPQAEQCLQEFNAVLLPCLTHEERAQNAVMLHIVKGVLGFICHKRGDQIAFFIAEQGPECIEAQKEHISNCMNATFSAYLPKADALAPQELTELPELLLGPKQCIDLHDFEECVLGYLELCNDITPANIIESLFRYVRKESKCQPEIERQLAERRIANSSMLQRSGQARARVNRGLLFGFTIILSLSVLRVANKERI